MNGKFLFLIVQKIKNAKHVQIKNQDLKLYASDKSDVELPCGELTPACVMCHLWPPKYHYKLSIFTANVHHIPGFVLPRYWWCLLH